MKTGVANLPLHQGRTPRWLFDRMVKLAREIVVFIISRYSADELLFRLSHPVWFQSLGCLLGFDWHSSGVTTTTCGALKEAVKGLEKDLGFFVCGGKGSASRRTPQEIKSHAALFSLQFPARRLIKASKLTAKVDSAALQDGYQLYHHTFFFTRRGHWAVVQQGMNPQTRYARRYHWLSFRLKSFVNHPHKAVCCDQKGKPLNLVARQSQAVRQAIPQIIRQPPAKLTAILKKLTVLDLPPRHYIQPSDLASPYLERIFLKTYQRSPARFQDLLLIKGVGPKTLRALTLLAELLAGARPSFTDPVRYAFAHGGKDGIPYPVDRPTYDQSIELLRQALWHSRLSFYEKRRAERRLLTVL